MKLRLIDPPPWLDPAIEVDGRRFHRDYEVGDCWYASQTEDGTWYMFEDGPSLTSRHSLVISSEHDQVTPMIVVLPRGHVFCLHGPTLTASGWGDKGWEITGKLPNVTVNPSIDYAPNLADGWHGWITDGEMR